MKKFKYQFKDSELEQESIRMHGSALEAEVKIFIGKDHDHWVCISPSINVSGYGSTIDEAKESLSHNIEIFMEDLFELNINSRVKYLKSLGWLNDAFFKRKFSKVFVDSDGVLQNLEKPIETSFVATY